MSEMYRVDSVVSECHSRHTCFSSFVDVMHFLRPAGQDDILLFCASVNTSCQTSIEIGGKILAENFKTSEHRHILSAYFTFVVTNENKKPTSVPQVILEIPDENCRYDEANKRREVRRKQASEGLIEKPSEHTPPNYRHVH